MMNRYAWGAKDAEQTEYGMSFRAMATPAYVLDRINYLKGINKPRQESARRIRTIMNGGQAAVDELLGKAGVAKDIPTVHLLDSGLTRFAQKLRQPPDVKVDSRADKDSQAESKRAEKRQRIVEGYDHGSRLPIQLASVGRWLPGYGFNPSILKYRRDANGYYYPHAEWVNPFYTYPGYWNGIDDPVELVNVRRLDTKTASMTYPLLGERIEAVKAQRHARNAGTWRERQAQGFAGDELVEIATYIDDTGCYVVAPEAEMLLDWIPNPLRSGPPFVLAKRPVFDSLVGHYDHAIGLMAQMARLNMLAMISAEDATMRETNIIGEMESDVYERGRNAVNMFSFGTQIERPLHNQAQHVFQQIDRLERGLRIGVNYSVADDGQSPQSFATGAGIDRLAAGGDNNIAEYQLVLEDALVRLDAKRLEWDETMYAGEKKPAMSYMNTDDRPSYEMYVPEDDIAGNYATRRVYGVMAGWDDASKIVAGLQLLQGKIIDRRTMQDNLKGLPYKARTNERIREDEAEGALMEMLRQRAAQGDPSATSALVEIMGNPKDALTTLEKFFTPKEPQMSPEEAAMAQQGGPGGLAGLMGGGGTPEDMTTVLSRLEQGGGVGGGGVQTVGQL